MPTQNERIGVQSGQPQKRAAGGGKGVIARVAQKLGPQIDRALAFRQNLEPIRGHRDFAVAVVYDLVLGEGTAFAREVEVVVAKQVFRIGRLIAAAFSPFGGIGRVGYALARIGLDARVFPAKRDLGLINLAPAFGERCFGFPQMLNRAVFEGGRVDVLPRIYFPGEQQKAVEY